MQSSTNTLRAELFGQTGDNPTVFGDYDNDGKEDIAVYRQSTGVWYYRTVVNGPVFAVQWGTSTDFVAPGDYDGDGRNDFAIQRAAGSQAQFWIRTAAGAVSVTTFGTGSDFVVPGDYDGDGKTDIAVSRTTSGQIFWFYLPSTGGSYVTIPFGQTGDVRAQGDYDGDGKTDVAVWRPNADPTQNFFYVNRSNGSGLLTFEWGQQGDAPTARYNTH